MRLLVLCTFCPDILDFSPECICSSTKVHLRLFNGGGRGGGEGGGH